MKTISLTVAVLGVSAVFAQDASKQNEAPPITFNNSNLKSGETYVYEQKPVSGRPVLIAPEQAKGLIDRFKTSYAKLGSPRMVVYVNRDLVDESSGVKLAERKERVQSNSTEIKSEYKADPNAPQPAAGAQIPSASNVTIVGDVSGNRNNVPGTGNV